MTTAVTMTSWFAPPKNQGRFNAFLFLRHIHLKAIVLFNFRARACGLRLRTTR